MDVRRAAIDAVLAHAREALPDECCGLLLGSEGRVEEAVRTRNVRASPTRYQIDPAEHFAAIRRVRAEGRKVVGAYHSHPVSPAVPSPTDIAEAFDDDLLHVIVSLRDAERAEVRGFRIAGGRAHEVTLVAVP